MKIDFDREIDRKSTWDLKWNGSMVADYLNTQVPEDFIPMWMADSDFACPPHVLQALRERLEKEVLGYCAPQKPFYDAVCWWQKERHGWQVDPAWITALPSVVAGINIALHVFTEEGDGVLVQTPVYDPFSTIVRRTGRRGVNNPLRQENGRFVMDYEQLEQLAADPSTKALILCSPHNPVGRVWEAEELRRLAEICLANNVAIISDEIHSDILLADNPHTPLLSLDARYADRFVCLTAPSKTFNIPGLKTAVAIIPNREVKEKFDQMQLAMSLDVRNTFGLVGLTASYTPEGEEWLAQELDYLRGNGDLVEEFLARELPQVRFIRPEGTFLCWLDCRPLGLSDEELLHRVVMEARVICVPGPWFGPGGEGYLRLNIGCTRANLKTALERLAAVLKKGEANGS